MTDWTETQVTTKASPRSVSATVSRLTGILAAKGMKVFAVIDQSEAAREAGMRLRETWRRWPQDRAENPNADGYPRFAPSPSALASRRADAPVRADQPG
jgi:hypothetical protein